MNFLGKAFERLIDPVMDVVGQAVPDKDKLAEIRFKITTLFVTFFTDVVKEQSNVIQTEIKAGWLTRNWRPITMLTFVGLIVAHWLGYTAQNLSEEERLALLEIVKWGIGGYVGGRSLEKVAKELGPIFKK